MSFISKDKLQEKIEIALKVLYIDFNEECNWNKEILIDVINQILDYIKSPLYISIIQESKASLDWRSDLSVWKTVFDKNNKEFIQRTNLTLETSYQFEDYNLKTVWDLVNLIYKFENIANSFHITKKI